MANKLPKELFNMPKVERPRAIDLQNKFNEFIEFCEAHSFIPDKFSWLLFIGTARSTWHMWQQDKENLYLNDTEFNDRLNTIKKIDDFVEGELSQRLMTAGKDTTGFIFYLKNAFKWSDRQEPEVSLNLKIEGYGLPKSGDNKPKEGNI